MSDPRQFTRDRRQFTRDTRRLDYLDGHHGLIASASPWMKSIASSEQVKPIRSEVNLVVNYNKRYKSLAHNLIVK